MAKVSIVLPSYNGEKYIRESIESIIRQTFQDWELIIVNDCSTDYTKEIAEEYAAKDSRIQVIHNEFNQKLPCSLNIGFEHATGEFLTWTSDDNYYLPEAIRKMQDYLVKNSNIFMVCSDMKLMNSVGEITGEVVTYDSNMIHYHNCVGASFMYRREVLEEVGKYDPSMFLVEDYEYWLRILYRYGDIGHIHEKLYVYREHENSLTATKKCQIKKQLAKLRMKNINAVFQHFQNDKKYLCFIYFELIEAGLDLFENREKFYQMLPELNIISELDERKEVIIYGAGDYGDRAYALLENKVAYYADRDIRKIGKYKNGVPIISIDEMVFQKDEFQILIAVSGEKIYEILKFLCEKGITKCSVYQNCFAIGL